MEDCPIPPGQGCHQSQLRSCPTRRDEQGDGCSGGRDGSEGKGVGDAVGHHNQDCLEKDLRIAGHIGESGQKVKLTFTSLARQIESIL